MSPTLIGSHHKLSTLLNPTVAFELHFLKSVFDLHVFGPCASCGQHLVFEHIAETLSLRIGHCDRGLAYLMSPDFPLCSCPTRGFLCCENSFLLHWPLILRLTKTHSCVPSSKRSVQRDMESDGPNEVTPTGKRGRQNLVLRRVDKSTCHFFVM